MQRTSKLFIVAALLLIPFMVFAMGKKEQTAAQNAANSGLPTTMARASEVMNTKVEVAPSVTGTIVDLVADWHGNIPYVIMTFDGIGAADQKYIIPVAMLDLSRAERRDQMPKFATAVTDANIANAPYLQNGMLPDTTSPNWDQPIIDYWKQNVAMPQIGQVPGPTAGATSTGQIQAGATGIAATWGQRQAVLLGQQLIGFQAVNRTNASLGKVEDAVISFVGITQPSIVYLAISGQATLGAGANLFPVTFDSFSLDIDKKQITVDTTESQLPQGFAQDKWPIKVEKQSSVGKGGTSGGAAESKSGTTTQGSGTTTENQTQSTDKTQSTDNTQSSGSSTQTQSTDNTQNQTQSTDNSGSSSSSSSSGSGY